MRRDTPPEHVDARLTYTVPTEEKPVTKTVGPGGRNRERTGTFEEHAVKILNARQAWEPPALATSSFECVDAPTDVVDFWDATELERRYYPEARVLIREHTGAERVVIFDHTLRSADASRQESRDARQPVSLVHNDYTEWSATERLRQVMPDEEIQELLLGRFAIVQLWRPTCGPVEQWPLAMCNARSIALGDLIASERRHPNRIGEIYQLAYNPDHRWFYFPQMQRDEALVFKCYDSADDGRAKFGAHTSFEDPTSPTDAAPRESIEIRSLVFFG